MKTLLLSIVFFILMACFTHIAECEPYPVGYLQERLQAYEQEKEIQEQERLASLILMAQIHVESRGNPMAFNPGENALGILQIRPIMLDHVNQLLRKQGDTFKYHLDDRLDSLKSVEMWRLVMDVHNPGLDIRQACLVWNGRGRDGNGSADYYQKVLALVTKHQNNEPI